MIGDRVIGKLKLFARDNGHFPKGLEELVPRYLDQLPVPSAGDRRWYYSVSKEGDGFYLSFSVPTRAPWHGYPACVYYSRYGFWYVDE